MALNIKNPETEGLIRQLADETGEDLTTAVTVAVRERLQRQAAIRSREPERLLRLADKIAAGPVRDARSDDDLIGYDERGLW
ncbi:MAG: type II toxin-antitoxin system VapB family antitoxin [Candidatus Eremiobacteraeota bacterium]|nr:type II toxin-antitoxin system VapB family antitoxin [Candidatus Eremiobacteraeota bacterium]